MRFALLVTATAVLLGVHTAPAKADWFDSWYTPRYEGPWCANASIGNGGIQSNCQFRTFEACRETIISGNRGFCTQNPRFAGYEPRPGRKYKRRHARR